MKPPVFHKEARSVQAVEAVAGVPPISPSTGSTTLDATGLQDPPPRRGIEAASTNQLAVVEAVEPVREAGVRPPSATSTCLEAERWAGGQIVSSAELAQIVQGADRERDMLWGPFLLAGAVAQVIAPASAGKTVLLKRLARALALQAEFLGFRPPRALRVLYVELESPLVVLRQHLEHIPAVPRLDFVRVEEERLRRLLEAEAATYDVVIVDPLALAFPVPDENDNALANRQLALFNKLKRAHGTAFVLAHNTGVEGERSRGATARKDRVDLEWILSALSQLVRKLTLDKDRLGNLHTTIEFEFAGDLDFRLLTVNHPPTTKVEDLAARVLREFATWGPAETRVERDMIRERLGIPADRDHVENRHLTGALGLLVKRGTLMHPNARGPYYLPAAAGHFYPTDMGSVAVATLKNGRKS